MGAICFAAHIIVARPRSCATIICQFNLLSLYWASWAVTSVLEELAKKKKVTVLEFTKNAGPYKNPPESNYTP